MLVSQHLRGRAVTPGNLDWSQTCRGWYTSQVSENTKTIYPKTQNTLHKIMGHTHDEVIIFKPVYQNFNLYFPQSTDTHLQIHLCFSVLMIWMVYRSCLGKRWKSFCMRCWLCLCNFKIQLKNKKKKYYSSKQITLFQGVMMSSCNKPLWANSLRALGWKPSRKPSAAS